MRRQELCYEDWSPAARVELSGIGRVEKEIDSLLEIGEGLLD